ncbi:hypothetical protein AB0A74_34990 [Saccharothrix sp. NPDC042600]|uniref:hypothetical protein n=1 Tax=Saccharothrix TaxID=2071 RepID=UPI0033D34101|nr:hypothetical protein GCM10017745_33300 [Saccharothrix mutabilis subsp. capreolus]
MARRVRTARDRGKRPDHARTPVLTNSGGRAKAVKITTTNTITGCHPVIHAINAATKALDGASKE